MTNIGRAAVVPSIPPTIVDNELVTEDASNNSLMPTSNDTDQDDSPVLAPTLASEDTNSAPIMPTDRPTEPTDDSRVALSSGNDVIISHHVDNIDPVETEQPNTTIIESDEIQPVANPTTVTVPSHSSSPILPSLALPDQTTDTSILTSFVPNYDNSIDSSTLPSADSEVFVDAQEDVPVHPWDLPESEFNFDIDVDDLDDSDDHTVQEFPPVFNCCEMKRE
ncbi:uncharacterized protein B0P05DRAFT_275610 [Gilbertella persicaria]|uniref:uncharacterized protein n=1 Tax=Gilbertella persicaria TaxID=101096 RepID=UPI0022203CEA|nr:uncharacterized protein B0P05DRAFT_275610 [Gilbertella persicaria]KAI8058907.1 hypothetical protein B0P05DRAFT_275610 [Gilbertella persicaria]